jgi:MOSC domain-containing protein YiiM
MAAEVVAIHLVDRAGEPMRAVDQAELVAGLGLVGDRYAAGRGTYSQTPSPGGGRQVTLFEAEVLDQLARELGIQLSAAEHRRNITTRGVRLDSLLGRRFRIGPVLCEGVRPCTPCDYLQRLVGKPVLAPLADRGGLRANVLEGGLICRGDPIVLAAAPSTAGAAPT